MIKENDEIKEDTGGPIFIANAGMVILGHYIQLLFERLGYLKDGMFKDEDSIQKGIYLLQYAVTGRENGQEQDLILNKIICGIPIHKNVEKQIAITDDEKKLIEGLLHAVIDHISILRNTTIEGFRQTFLLRNGKIKIEDNRYLLIVEKKAFDMLLDKIPWGFEKIKFSWMQRTLDVEWRN